MADIIEGGGWLRTRIDFLEELLIRISDPVAREVLEAEIALLREEKGHGCIPGPFAVTRDRRASDGDLPIR